MFLSVLSPSRALLSINKYIFRSFAAAHVTVYLPWLRRKQWSFYISPELKVGDDWFSLTIRTRTNWKWPPSFYLGSENMPGTLFPFLYTYKNYILYSSDSSSLVLCGHDDNRHNIIMYRYIKHSVSSERKIRIIRYED